MIEFLDNLNNELNDKKIYTKNHYSIIDIFYVRSPDCYCKHENTFSDEEIHILFELAFVYNKLMRLNKFPKLWSNYSDMEISEEYALSLNNLFSLYIKINLNSLDLSLIDRNFKDKNIFKMLNSVLDEPFTIVDFPYFKDDGLSTAYLWLSACYTINPKNIILTDNFMYKFLKYALDTKIESFYNILDSGVSSIYDIINLYFTDDELADRIYDVIFDMEDEKLLYMNCNRFVILKNRINEDVLLKVYNLNSNHKLFPDEYIEKMLVLIIHYIGKTILDFPSLKLLLDMRTIE